MTVCLAVVQSGFGADVKENQERVFHYIRKAKELGAQIVLLPELHDGDYFCKTQDDRHFARAVTLDNYPVLELVQALCQKLELVVPWSFFEKSGPHFYNSLAMIDADGSIAGVYRKSHLPDGPGYQEKYYFRPGDTGFMVFNTKFARVGAAICWDQWFPEVARILTLKGAEMILYPTAIGSEPQTPTLCTKEPWLRVMKGHAVANMMPIAAANRGGVEAGQTFYGNSFVCDEFGEDILRFDQEHGVKIAAVDVRRAAAHRASFGFFRDRRADLYGELLT